jgi:hypothetical protein
MDQAEAASQAGMPMDPQDFIRLFHTAAMPPGQVSTVRSDFANGATPAAPKPATSSSASAPVKEKARPSISQASSSTSLSAVVAAQSPVKPARPVPVMPPMPPSPAPVRTASPEVQEVKEEVPVKPKQERTKSTTDVRTLAKYTKDGETLRELMASIMKTLKLSQGSIANEYYRNFRYETSQGGVSAWFHFRGNSGTFDGMNHCALMWVDDHKQHLTEEEQRVFAEVNKRMSQHSPGRPHPERSATPVTLPTRDATAEVTAQELAEAAAMLSAATTPPAVSEAPASVPMVCDDALEADAVAWDKIEPLPIGDEDIGIPVSRVEAASEGKVLSEATANRAVSDDEGGQDADGEGSGSSSDEDSDTASTSPKKSAMDVSEHEPSQPRASTSQHASEQGSLPSLSDASANHMIRPTDSLSLKLAVSRQIGSDLFAAGQSSSSDNSTGASAGQVAVKAESEDGAEGGAAPNSELPAPLGVIRTIEDLHSSVVYEMNRRKVSQSRAAVEANLRDLGMGQPALSKFLSVATINNNERGKLFSGGMVRYVSSFHSCI